MRYKYILNPGPQFEKLFLLVEKKQKPYGATDIYDNIDEIYFSLSLSLLCNNRHIFKENPFLYVRTRHECLIFKGLISMLIWRFKDDVRPLLPEKKN